jgi:hypothetical protein
VKNNSNSHLLSYFGWLKATEFWQRLVVRSPKQRGTILLYFCMAMGTICWVDISISWNTPALKFEELDKRTGVLLQNPSYSLSYNPKRNWGNINLRLPDGKIVIYNGSRQPKLIASLKGLIGETITIYSQKQFRAFHLSYREFPVEVECKDNKLLVYNYELQVWRHNHFWRFGTAWILAAIPTLMILLPLLRLWRIGRKLDESAP